MKCPGYPRIFRLSDYWNNTWLLGGNELNGLSCRRSLNGKNWSEPIEIINCHNYSCSNIDFYELLNHDIISSYRVIGKNSNLNPEIKFNRRLCSSISHDGGVTWKNLDFIVDNFELAQSLGKTKQEAIDACIIEERIGFFEPFVISINNNISVFYADDFTTMIMKPINDNPFDNYRSQNIYSQIFNLETKKWEKERKLIMNGAKKKTPTGSGLKERISRDGMPVVSKMKDGSYILIFEGTYRDKDYPYLTGFSLNEYHSFEILLSYSKDGYIWSNPIEVYIPNNNGSKSSAPFVVSNDNNQIIISFQTDEDSIPSGFEGDNFSISKVMISKPNISIEHINKDSFYGLCNINDSPIGGRSIWGGIMVYKNILYAFSSDNYIRYSELPIYDDPNKYNDKIRDEYHIISGNISVIGNKITSSEEKTIVINKNINISYKNYISTYITVKNNNYKCGLIFGIKNINEKYEKMNFFIFMIDKQGNLILLKYLKGHYYRIDSDTKKK